MQFNECIVLNVDDINVIDNINDVENNNKIQYYEYNEMNTMYEYWLV